METDEGETEGRAQRSKKSPTKRSEPEVDDVMKNKFFTGIRGKSSGSSGANKRQSTSGTASSRASKGRRSAGASGVSLFSDIDPDADDGEGEEVVGDDNEVSTEPEAPSKSTTRRRGTPKVDNSSAKTPATDSSHSRQRRSRQRSVTFLFYI